MTRRDVWIGMRTAWAILRHPLYFIELCKITAELAVIEAQLQALAQPTEGDEHGKEQLPPMGHDRLLPRLLELAAVLRFGKGPLQDHRDEQSQH